MTSPRGRKLPPNHASAINVDDFRSLCIGSPIPTAAHNFDPPEFPHSKSDDGEPEMLNYSDHTQDRMRRKIGNDAIASRCPAITVDSSKVDAEGSLTKTKRNSTESSHDYDQPGGEFNAESGANDLQSYRAKSPGGLSNPMSSRSNSSCSSPTSPVLPPPSSPGPLEGLAPRSPLQRRAANNSRYVTYHRADLPAPASRSGEHQRGAAVSETTETLVISATGGSRGHTRAETYPHAQGERSKRRSPTRSDPMKLTGAPLVPGAGSSDNSGGSSLLSRSPQDPVSPRSGGSGGNFHQKRGLPVKLAPLNTKNTPAGLPQR